MFISTIKSEGLAHLSYLLGDGGVAAVVDPRRDCEVYLHEARARGWRITHVLETHRNEDLLSGGAVLADLTGATVLHGPNAAGTVAYARTVREGESFDFGNLRVRVLETPGHTDDSLSFALYDRAFSEASAVGVCTGDALFVGDVGRTDFYPQRREEVAGLLYDSLRKLLALGDQAIVYPAHGAGSVCGGALADREFSTLGFERLHNPMLRIADREAFIARKLAEHHDQPPYFREMERLNLTGAAAAGPLAPPPLGAGEFAARVREGATALDVRPVAEFLGAHVPDSLALPVAMIPAFAGWMLASQERLVLVADGAAQAATAARHLARIGYDHVEGFLAPALPAWAAGGQAFRQVPAVSASAVRARIETAARDWTLLDVRGVTEVRKERIAGSRHVYVGELPARLAELARDRAYTVMCASGARATIAASVLLRAGFAQVDVFMGSTGAWKARGYPLEPA
jgi:hydroxyacylglutathione hydrolase